MRRALVVLLSLVCAIDVRASVAPCQPKVVVAYPIGQPWEARFDCYGEPAIVEGAAVSVTASNMKVSGSVKSIDRKGSLVTIYFVLLQPPPLVGALQRGSLTLETVKGSVTWPATFENPEQQQTSRVSGPPKTLSNRRADPSTPNQTTTHAPQGGSLPDTPPNVSTLSDDIIWIGQSGETIEAVTSRGAYLRRDGSVWKTMTGPDVQLPIGAALVNRTESVNALTTDARLLAEAVDRAKISTLSLGRAGLFGVTNEGQLLTYASTESRWLPVPSPSKNTLSVAFRDRIHGVAAGIDGYIARTEDGGRKWTEQHSNTHADLTSIAFGPAGMVYAAGKNGTVLQSLDDGENWRHVTAEWNGPARDGVAVPPLWYIIFNAFVTLPLLAIAARSLPRDEKTIESDSVAETIGSDRPLEKGDPDPINLRSIALAISRFLRNESTLPPLTVAVTGEWGSGKSSLMNLLRADLTDFGFRPVWFNAWHHQKEEHLLASLLQAVRHQAVPRWWRPENFFFRLRLIWIRGWKHRANLLLLILFLSLAIGFESKHHTGNVLDQLAKFAQDMSQKDAKTIATELLPQSVLHEILALMSIVAVLGTSWRGLKAFRMNPATLLASVSGSAKVNDLSAEIGFRDKFASEFSDVTKALGERSLLIFIDDLDRCSPASVGDVLEAVNFLVSSGDCFVVIGMDRTRVERYIKVNFKEVSLDEADFSTKYLDKLINIEVPVPEPTDDASTQILVPLHIAAPEGQSNWRLLRQLAADSLHFWPMALAVVIAVAGFLSGRRAQEPAMPLNPASALETTAPAVPPPAIPKADSPPTPAPPPQTPLKTNQPGDVLQGDVARLHFWIYWPAVLFMIPLIGVGVWLITRPRDLVVHDSPLFLEAINIWRPVIAQKLRTPRALKRFMNRLRYLAMRQRPQEEEMTLWRQLQLWITGKKRETPPPVTNAIPEPALVALAAMELWPIGVPQVTAKISEHRSRFNHNPDDWIAAYGRTTAGVHAN